MAAARVRGTAVDRCPRSGLRMTPQMPACCKGLQVERGSARSASHVRDPAGHPNLWGQACIFVLFVWFFAARAGRHAGMPSSRTSLRHQANQKNRGSR